MLAQVFPHGNGRRNADVQALNLPKLGDCQGPDVGIGGDIRTDAVFFMAEDKGAVSGKGDLGEGGTLDRIQRKKGVAACAEIPVTGFKMRMEPRGHPFKGAHGRGRIKKIDADQVDFTGAEGVGTSEYFANIESGFQTIQNNDEVVGARMGQEISIFLPPKSLLGRDSLLLNTPSDLSEPHGFFDSPLFVCVDNVVTGG